MTDERERFEKIRAAQLTQLATLQAQYDEAIKVSDDVFQRWDEAREAVETLDPITQARERADAQKQREAMRPALRVARARRDEAKNRLSHYRTWMGSISAQAQRGDWHGFKESSD